MNTQPKQDDFALSPTHSVVDEIVRCFDPVEVNAIVNHPKVRPYLGGSDLEPLDLTNFVRDPANYALRYEGFLALFHAKMPGLYEVHTQALPASRGAVVAAGAPAMATWMFTRTNAIELVTRIPDDNDAARELAVFNGFSLEFRCGTGWIAPEGNFPVDWYRLGITDWMARADGLIERGQWFHREIEAACQRAGIKREDHPDDETHDRYVGAAAEMILHGHTVKGIHFINRYSAIVGNPPVVLLNDSPLVIHIGDCAVRLDGGRLEIVKSQ